jgi:hypothetical protein
MNDQNILSKIERLAKQVCKPSRGVTKKAEPTISFALCKIRHSKGKTTMSVYRCRIIKAKNESKLTINDKHTNEDDEERVYCLLLELYKFQKANKHRQ